MTAVDPRWVVRHGVRCWEGGTFPEPYDADLIQYTADPGTLCGKRRGTNKGARWHYRHNERPCEDCRNAANARKKDRPPSKIKKCVDCKTPITSRATRCQACGCGRINAHQTKRKEAA